MESHDRILSWLSGFASFRRERWQVSPFQQRVRTQSTSRLPHDRMGIDADGAPTALRPPASRTCVISMPFGVPRLHVLPSLKWTGFSQLERAACLSQGLSLYTPAAAPPTVPVCAVGRHGGIVAARP
jgi:hypothetical protein